VEIVILNLSQYLLRCGTNLQLRRHTEAAAAVHLFEYIAYFYPGTGGVQISARPIVREPFPFLCCGCVACG
jgi:hypothetical protein